MEELRQFKEDFNEAFAAFLDTKFEEAKKITDDPLLLELIEHGLQLAKNGGKRIRPYMAHLAYNAHDGAKDKEANNLFMALELLHTGILVQDDIMDKGTQRYNLPTTHVHAESLMRAEKRKGDLPHVALSQAMLVGNLLLNWAQEIINLNSDFDPKTIDTIRKKLSDLITQVSIGQMMDIDITTKESVRDEDIETKDWHKTAYYTFIQPMKIGALLAADEPEVLIFYEKFGKALGIAFQIRDDIEDVLHRPKDANTSTQADLRARLHTRHTQYVRKYGTDSQVATLNSLFGADIQPEDHDRVVALFQETGAIDDSKRMMKEYFDEAKRLLSQAPFPEEKRKPWYDLIAYLESK